MCEIFANIDKQTNKNSSNVHTVQFSRSVMSGSLQPQGLKHTGFPVHHQHPELTQTHVHRAGDAIQPSHPLNVHTSETFLRCVFII